jgi:hypothetical protein
MEGTCLCKAVKIKVNDDNLFGTQRRGHVCHCQNCRKVAGSCISTNLAIEEEKVVVEGMENLTCYPDKDTLSGNTVSRYFCRTCGV